MEDSKNPMMAMMRTEDDDLLSFLLGAYQLSAGVMATPSLCGAWQFGTAGMRRATFHFIGQGEAWLHTRNSEPRQISAGDLAVMPHDAWHMLSPDRSLRGENPVMSMEGEGPFTTILCGYFEFLAGRHNPILDALPEVIVVPAEEGGQGLIQLGNLLITEANTEGLGTASVINKLADTLFVMVVRHYLRTSENPRGLLAGMADPGLRRVLEAIHRRSGDDWSLERMAKIAGMSRTTFAQRFSEMLGSTPNDYLTRWRMTQAELMLRDPGTSVAQAAGRVGYEDESAFRKAFKRIHGTAPGALRRWFRDKMGR
ncbi:MAG: AraC family transcriptional regulator [Gammaproteobacteria bacterium HGW-Gammaproteobacteria-7]|nr:MAG: AraC family transcriptional regulator [Gammaproteobacteria bacterium HGW-Gammaproteobacteria-7]